MAFLQDASTLLIGRKESVDRRSQQHLTQELDASRQLHQASTQLFQADNIQALFDQILDTAVAALHADFASIQLLDRQRGPQGELRMIRHRGFPPDAARFWEWVRAASECTCGVALRTGQRVVVPDVEAFAFLPGSADQETYRQAGIRAVQTTPLLSRSGAVLGMLSTHWRSPHEPAEGELRLLDMLARQAADLIERHQAEAALREREAWLRGQREALEAALNGAPLETSLGALVKTAADGLGEGTRAAFYLADREGCSLHHLVGMPADYAAAVDGFKIGPESVACGLAMHTGQPVLTADVMQDPRWEPWRWMAERFDYRGCWSFPIHTSVGKFVGTFAVYWRQPRAATQRDLELVSLLTHTASIINSRHTEAEARKRAEGALRESEGRLRLALAAAQMGTWSWEVAADCHRRDANLNRLLGLEPVETVLPIEEFFEHVHPEERAAVREAFDASVRHGHNLRVAFRVVRPGGEVRWLRDQGDVFGGPASRHLAGACLDITEPKLLEEALREADRRKDEFLAMLGHELRNPLAPLRGVMEILQRQQLEGPALERAHAMMERQVGHLTRLVDDLLDVSRITRGLVELRREPVNLAEVANQAAEMAAPAIAGRGHDLSLTLPRKPVRVEGDATRLTQILFNLLNNAAKYTDAGGKIWLTVEREGEQAVVRVRDNGSGMKPELVARVFDLFTQGDRTPDRAQGGLGLGLTLVKRLVEMHGGGVEACSDGPGKGSEFTVQLPALPPDAEKPATHAPGPPQPQVQVDRALVVDDNPDVAESVTWMLEGLAREIEMVHNGQAALDLVGRWRPDIILCDIGMPGMDGYETCRRLRQLPGLDKVVIAAVSGYGGAEDRRKSQEAGFDLHLVKPIGRATLEEFVKSAAGA